MVADTRYKRRPEIEAAPMQGETVLYHPGTRKFCILNPTATYLWSQLDRACTADELTAGVLSAFAGVEQDVAARDVADTLRQFADLEMISRGDP